MTCASCVSHVERALSRVPGVQEARVNLASERATVALAPGGPSIDALIEAVDEVGYTATVASEDAGAPSEQKDQERHALRRDLILAAILSTPVAVIGMLPMQGMGWLPQ